MEARILVIESNSDLRRLFEHLLHSDGYQAESCSDWRDAQAAISQHLPDLIVYDWDLHNSAGYHWAASVRSRPETASIPLLFVCEGPPPRRTVELLGEAGISLIDKPFDIFVFRRRIEALLGIRERVIGG